MANSLPWSDTAIMHEYARITRSVSVYAAPQQYSNASASAVGIMWQKIVAGIRGVPGATIAVQLEIGQDVSPADMVASLRNASANLERTNTRLGANATIGTVMVDQEGWGTWDPQKITAYK